MFLYPAATVCLGLLVWCTWVNARDGLSSYWSKAIPAEVGGLSLVDRAQRFSPYDPRPFDVRARYLVNAGNFSEAEPNFQSAVSLRPHDYLLWLRLGNARELMGDQQGAIAAYGESIRLAPDYSMPHWYLGNLFLQMRSLDQAFSELRETARIDPRRLPIVIDYAWKEFKGDPDLVRRAMQPQTQSEYLTLARRFVREGKIADAMALYRAAGELPDSGRRLLLSRLLNAKAYAEAYEVWSGGRTNASKSNPSSLTNGDFEFDIDPNAVGFEWQIPGNLAKVHVVRDYDRPESGGYSLRLDFNGDSSADTELVSQIALTEGGARYQLNFAARSLKLVSGGLPLVEVIDAADGQTLGRSQVIPENQTKWDHYTVPFTTQVNTRAVIIVIKRANCSSSPCPAFGHAWFDNFTLKKL
jgi:Tfp pilus assembly protein PilF